MHSSHTASFLSFPFRKNATYTVILLHWQLIFDSLSVEVCPASS
jgi:hypothetical protein